MFAPGTTPNPPTRPAQISRQDVAVQVLHDQHVEPFGPLHELHAGTVHDHRLLLDILMPAGDPAEALQEQPVAHLHDVGLVHSGHFAATVLFGVLEGVLTDAHGGFLGDDLQTLHHSGNHPVLDAGVEPFCVLPDHYQIHVLEARPHSGHVLDGAQAGVQLQGLPQCHVGALVAAANGGG